MSGGQERSPEDRGQRWRELRERAEAALRGDGQDGAEELAETVHELEIRSVELEMQMEEAERERVLADNARRGERTARERFGEIFELAPVRYLVLETRGVIREANRAAGALLGCKPEALVGKNAQTFAASQGDADRLYLLLQRARESGGGPVEVELAGERPVIVRIDAALRKGEGEEPEVLAALTDITELRQTDRALREQKRRLRAVLDTAIDGIVAVDESGSIEDLNPAAARLFGCTPTDVIGRDVALLIPALRKTGPAGGAFGRRSELRPGPPREVRGRRIDGSEFPLELGAGELAGARGGAVAVIRDLTEKRRLEAEYRQAQKMEAVGRLAAGVAHDFNNVLMAITSAAQLAERKLGPDAPVRGFLEKIRSAASSGTGLAKKLLALSRPPASQMVVESLGDDLAAVEPLLRQVLGEQIALTIHAPERPVWMRIGRGALDQVLMNLALNARDAMPEGGSLTIDADTVVVDPDAAESRPGLHPGAYARIRVTDTGCGMDEDIRRRAFDPFFTTKGESGTGLGLSTVYGIITGAGGHVSLESEPEAGTTFELFIPVSSAPSGERKGGAQRVDIASGAGHSVLVVEDAEIVRAAVRRLLEDRGFEVIEAASGEEAIDIVRGRAVDALLLDVVLPDTHAGELERRLRAIRPRAAAVRMTGHAPSALESECKIAPGPRTLEKPFSDEALARALAGALADVEGRGE